MKIVPFELDSASSLLIKAIWIIEEANGIDVDVKSFPTGYPYISVISGTSFRIIDTKDDVLEARSYLSGNSVLPFDLNMPLISRSLTVQLKPYAIPYLFGIPASDFVDYRVPLSSFSPYLSRRFEALIESDLSSGTVLKEVVTILKEYSKGFMVDKRMLCAIEEIIRFKGNASMDIINSKINLSQRRLQQLFKEHIGISPKTYSKIVRVQHHTFEILNGKCIDSVVPEGYFDQSHFIHELKKQTSMSPNAFSQYINAKDHKSAYFFSNLFYGLQ